MVRVLELITGEYFKVAKLCIDGTYIAIGVVGLFYLHKIFGAILELNRVLAVQNYLLQGGGK